MEEQLKHLLEKAIRMLHEVTEGIDWPELDELTEEAAVIGVEVE